jgi:hypothetical protein
MGHADWVFTVTFAPDGQTLASASFDGAVRLWPARTETLAELVCTRVWRNLTLDEWRQFMGEDVPYERTCRDLSSGDGIAPSTPGTPTPVAVDGPTQDLPLDRFQDPIQALKDLLDGFVLPARSSPPTDGPNPAPIEPSATSAAVAADAALRDGTPPPLSSPSVSISSQEP